MTFGLRGLTQRFFKLSTPEDETLRPSHFKLQKEIEKLIPEPISGFEPSLKEMVEGNKDKNYPALPYLKEGRYKPWYEFAQAMEGMVEKYGVHAAGLVITDEPLKNYIPLYKTSDFERVTQWDKKQVEGDAGLLKFDLLVIKNLDILQYCVKLIEERHGKKYDIYNIEDGDEAAYKLMAAGHLTGVFQFETSDVIKKATVQAKPTSISELSDLSSLVRPGPAQAGYLDMYLNDEQDDDLPEAIREHWSDTKGVLVYQEQLMSTFVEFAGYTEQEADGVRRIVGRKEPAKLAKLKPDVVERLQAYGKLTAKEAERFWDVVIGCGSYLFNRSHSVAYSYVSYLCAYFKANYPVEFFCALMTERAEDMQPKDWAAKAPEYMNEAKLLGIDILPPSIQKSSIGFTIASDTEIYFGLNGIRSVGLKAARTVIQARGANAFKDVMDFAYRVNRSKLNTKHFSSLVIAGCFDQMGYARQDLLDNVQTIYDYFKNTADYQFRLMQNQAREAENEQLIPLLERRDELRKIRSRKRDRDLTPEEEEFLENCKGLRKKTMLKVGDKPTPPEIDRHSTVKVTLEELLSQQQYIGCFLGKHPAPLLFPEAMPLREAYEGLKYDFCGFVTEAREFKTKASGKNMGICEMGDGTNTAKIILFPRTFARFKEEQRPKTGDVIKVFGRVQAADSMIEIIADRIKISRS